MERKFFLETVVPIEFDLGRTEAKASKPKNPDAAAAYHAGYDCPPAVQDTIRAYVIQTATKGYDDGVRGTALMGLVLPMPELKDEKGVVTAESDPRSTVLVDDCKGVYQESLKAPTASVPPGFEKMGPISKTPNTIIGAVGGGVLGFLGSLILGGGITSKVGATVIGAGAGALYMRSKTPGD